MYKAKSRRCVYYTNFYRRGVFMNVLFIILGILMVIGGFSCMFTPVLTFMSTGYFLIILVTVYGVFGIINAIRFKRFGIGFVFSILSVLLGIASFCVPNMFLLASGVMLYIVAGWFVVMGIVDIYTSIAITRKAIPTGLWILQLILGIIAVLIGIYSFFRPAALAITEGVLIGIFFIETGLSMMFLPAIRRN